MKKVLKFLWWLILLPVLVIIIYEVLGFIILHSLGWENIQISTATSLILPYVFIGIEGLGIWKLKKTNK